MAIPIALLALSLGIILSSAEVLGPVFPPPADLTSDDSLVKAAWDALSTKLDEYLIQGHNSSAFADLTGAENVTWSAGLFSTLDPAASRLQYHWTSPEIANAASGTHEVDGNSIYRVASVSKLVTVFAGMLELTHKEWHTPISELIPGLGPGGEDDDPLSPSQWDAITPWALANQQSGVATFGIPVLDLLGTYTIAALTTNTSITELEATDGFPPELPSSLGPCTDVEMPLCYAEDFIASVKTLHPNYLPWTTPAYSNFGLILLGLAISNATGKSYDDIYFGSIFEPLGMSSSFLDAPTGGEDFDRSVIVGPSAELGGFLIEGSQITIPSGGMLSTINDLAKLGVGIMNSTLLAPGRTREWLKPHGHTASLTYAVGAPWEIVRYVNPNTSKVTDIYVKLGDAGNYGGILAIIPDYNAGFSFLNAATTHERSGVALNVINRITETIVPALEAQAALEARDNFIGEYLCSDSSLNSSLTITFNESAIDGPSTPSLSISRWISNGTDMLPFFGNIKPQLQLTIPKQSHGPGKVTFQASTVPQYNSYMAAGLGPFSGAYATNFGWLSVDQTRYAGNGVAVFVFDVDDEGNAEAVLTAGTQAVLKRKFES